MSRAIQLGCESCDFEATLYQHEPVSADENGQIRTLDADSREAPVGYWIGGLCGSCRLPVHVFAGIGDLPGEKRRIVCDHCGEPCLDFDDAATELAAASHSRAWRDEDDESAVAVALQVVLDCIPALSRDLAAGDITVQEALGELAAPFSEPTRGRDRTGIRATAESLHGLSAELVAAHDLATAEAILRQHLKTSQNAIRHLRTVISGEVFLPGVPCPKCQTGQLVHWPVW